MDGRLASPWIVEAEGVHHHNHSRTRELMGREFQRDDAWHVASRSWRSRHGAADQVRCADVCIVVAIQHPRQFWQHTWGAGRVVHLDVEEILGADGRDVILHDLIGEVAQGEESSVAAVLDDLS
jgi:hypothetical protein